MKKHMKKKMTLLVSALVGIFSTGFATKDAFAKKGIHCKGISTKWVNDCSANGHACAAQATKNFDKNEFLIMGKEDCMAIQNALKNQAVKDYVEKIQKGTIVAAKRGKKF